MRVCMSAERGQALQAAPEARPVVGAGGASHPPLRRVSPALPCCRPLLRKHAAAPCTHLPALRLYGSAVLRTAIWGAVAALQTSLLCESGQGLGACLHLAGRRAPSQSADAALALPPPGCGAAGRPHAGCRCAVAWRERARQASLLQRSPPHPAPLCITAPPTPICFADVFVDGTVSRWFALSGGALTSYSVFTTMLGEGGALVLFG